MLRNTCIAILLLATSAVAFAEDLGTGITYQGNLQFNNTPANGIFDFQVELYAVSSGGTRIGNLVSVEDVTATDGIFTLELDFGALPFDGDQLWLNIGIREGASVGGYTGLLPRQKITATPFALHAEAVAAGAVGSAEINAAQVQKRVTGSCAVGSFIKSIDQNGSVTCAADLTGLTSVTGAEIVDGSIGAVDLNPSQSYTLGGATINGSMQLNGALTISSVADIIIRDSLNAIRWKSVDGLTEFATIQVGGADVMMIDSNQSRFIFYSNTNGIGLGTFTPSSGYAVTTPSLHVEGQTKVGLVRVSASYALSSYYATCSSRGNLPCYYGNGTVQCPVGTKVMGGGSNGYFAHFGNLSYSYPDSTSSWACASSYDSSGASRTCYALCARLE